ncbi:MAG: pitrilysin family protein [Aestuariivita sp.]|nr:pitrilysin family protein [Aestuariivita sp.]
MLLSFPTDGYATINIQPVESANGISAWLVEDHTIPFMALEVRFRGGTSLDMPESRGAINLMTSLLDEGAGELDAQAFARKLEELAAIISFEATDDAVSVSAKFLSENRNEAVELLKLALTKPRFSPDEIDRVREAVLSGLRADQSDPDVIAANVFAEMAYGNHPYGSSGMGTIESVSAITRDQIVASHRSVFALDRVFVGAVGDITKGQLQELIDVLLSDLPLKGGQMPDTAEVNLAGGITVVPFETPQSVVVFGQEGIFRDDPDFFPAYVMNHILGGGGFESRLMKEVREERGLTYGVYSYLLPKDFAAVYLGGVSSANDRVAEAVSVIQSNWRRIVESGVTSDELDAAKVFLTGAYPLRFDGNSRIARIIVGMQMQNLGLDYVSERNNMVNAVTLDDVNRVAKELLSLEKLHFVVVGQPEGLESTDQ